MGSRGRSIRLRIYFLVAIPLITMLGLFGYVAYTSVTNWLNLDQAPSLIKATVRADDQLRQPAAGRAAGRGRLPVAPGRRQPERVPERRHGHQERRA